MKDTAAQSEARASARNYAIRAREEATTPYVIAAEKKLPVESIDYDIQEFDVILGMDWLSLHEVVRLMRKGNKAFLAYIFDTRGSESKLDQLPVVGEFADVFSEELSSLPPDREVEFVIDVIPGTTLISVTPYHMTPVELKELKAQLQELLD
ncbi:uncharacterized protein LOC128042996 [Gossypium raimondii]|uniref:uncharacterized protein LOC128042996 n=1 Tax=Gossypium raimondii TaxID=29730 RepID=UPI00227CF4A1|nr:uncharacterized protein LOC128042996 [Gossypium raimondii]